MHLVLTLSHFRNLAQWKLSVFPFLLLNHPGYIHTREGDIASNVDWCASLIGHPHCLISEVLRYVFWKLLKTGFQTFVPRAYLPYFSATVFLEWVMVCGAKNNYAAVYHEFVPRLVTRCSYCLLIYVPVLQTYIHCLLSANINSSWVCRSFEVSSHEKILRTKVWDSTDKFITSFGRNEYRRSPKITIPATNQWFQLLTSFVTANFQRSIEDSLFA